MSTRVSITYNTKLSSRSLSSYRLDISSSFEPATERLTQRGPVYNNLVTYTGVFRTERDGVMAALEYITVPGYRIVRNRDQSFSLRKGERRLEYGCVTVGGRLINDGIYLA